MKIQTLGVIISSLRKEKGMTQMELANLMNVTDKAVSKWERDISCPDINTLPKLAECLEVSVDDLMQCKSRTVNPNEKSIAGIMNILFKAMPVAMGIAVTTLSIMNEIDMKDAFLLLGVGVTSAGIALLNSK